MCAEKKIGSCSICGRPITGIDVTLNRMTLEATMCLSCRSAGQEALEKIKSGVNEIKAASSKEFTHPWNLKK